MRSRPSFRPLLLAPVALALAVSCATVKIDSWMDQAFKGRPIGKVLVLGISDSENIQRRYEDLFVTALDEVGVVAEAGGKYVDGTRQVTEEELDKQVDALDLDTIIVTRVVDEKSKVRYEEPLAPPPYYGGYYGYYGFSYSYARSPGYLSNYREIHLETNLYDVKSGNMVWTGRKIITDDRSDQSNMENVIKAVVKDLGKYGLIPPGA